MRSRAPSTWASIVRQISPPCERRTNLFVSRSISRAGRHWLPDVVFHNLSLGLRLFSVHQQFVKKDPGRLFLHGPSFHRLFFIGMPVRKVSYATGGHFYT